MDRTIPIKPSAFLTERKLYSFAGMLALVLIVGIAASPWVCEQADMFGCWLPWARATQGYRPWNAYSLSTCNYPPFMLYVLTAVEAVLRSTGRSPWSTAAIMLVKLPSLLALVAGAIVCRMGLRGIWGESTATAVATLYVVCPPLWFNAALWGQFDAVLCLAMLGAVIALMNDRPLLSAACVGWALSIKVQAIVVVPIVVVYVFRRFGWGRTFQAGGVAAIVLLALIAPMVLAGQWRGVRLSYTGAVDYFPYLSNDAFNPWALYKQYNIHIQHLPGARSMTDSHRMLGLLSAKHLGMLVFSGYALFLLIGLYLRPVAYNVAFASGLMALAFFMLLTQMHERYSIPAVALLTLSAFSGGGRIYLCAMIPSLVNQVKSLVSEQYGYHSAITPALQQCFDAITILTSLVSTAVLVYVSWAYCIQVYAGNPAPAGTARSGAADS